MFDFFLNFPVSYRKINSYEKETNLHRETNHVKNISSEVWDCIIVGAGVLGCSTGKYLQQKHPNWKILLLDKFLTAGQGNTIKSNAAYRNIFDTDLNIQLANSSVEYYKKVELEGTDLGLKEIGYLWLLSKSQFEQRLEPTLQHPNDELNKISFIEYLDKKGIPIRIFEKNELKNLLPELQMEFTKEEMNFEGIELNLENIEYGLQGLQCGSLSPDLLVNHYLNDFKESGGTTTFGKKVVEIILKERGKYYDPDYVSTVWRSSEVAGVKTIDIQSNEEGIIETKNLVLATGAWINQLLTPLGVQTPVNPKKRQLFRILKMDQFVRKEGFNTINTFPFLILPVGGIFIKPIFDANAVDVGCSDDIGRRFEISSPRASPTDNPILDNPTGEMEFYATNIEPIVSKYFPSVFSGNLIMEKPSAGMYAYSLDKFPVIDKVDQLGNLFYVTGASGSGIMKADSIGRIAAGLISQEQKTELFNGLEVDISRFSVSKRKLPKETLVL